jgi:hypothetical protein
MSARSLDISRLVDIFLAGRLILADEVRGDMTAEPVCKLHELLAETIHGLLIHVRLGNELWERHCAELVETRQERRQLVLTKETGEMLCTVGVGGTLVLVVRIGNPLLVKLIVLGPLKSVSMWLATCRDHEMTPSCLPVQQDAAEALVEILAHAGNDLLQNLHGSRALLTMGALVGEIVVQNLVYRMSMRQRHELLVLRDVLPVVDKHGFQVIRNGKLDRRAVMKTILLKES